MSSGGSEKQFRVVITFPQAPASHTELQRKEGYDIQCGSEVGQHYQAH